MTKSKNEIDRDKFELTVKKNAIKVEDFLEKVKKGQIKNNEWVFTLDAVLKIADRAAIGIYWNSRKLNADPKGKWIRDHIRKMVTQTITDAFSK